MFYTFPFKNYLCDGTEELVEYVRSRGDVIIFTDGDLVYQPMKIKNLNFSRDIDEIFVFEDKMGNIQNILKIYSNSKKIVLDDKITILEEFEKRNKEVITIHIKQGSYKSLLPKNKSFKADFEVVNTRSALDVIKNLHV